MQNRLSNKKFDWKKNGRLIGFGTSPETDWKIIFNTTIVLSVLVIVLNIFIFIKIDKGEIFATEKTLNEQEQALNLVLLNETISYYKDKAIEFERIKNSKQLVADPSL